MIDELVDYNRSRYADDRRRVHLCGIVDGKIRVEWLPAAAAGVDAQWETRLYGLVRTGDRPGASRNASLNHASVQAPCHGRTAHVQTANSRSALAGRIAIKAQNR